MSDETNTNKDSCPITLITALYTQNTDLQKTVDSLRKDLELYKNMYTQMTTIASEETRTKFDALNRNEILENTLKCIDHDIALFTPSIWSVISGKHAKLLKSINKLIDSAFDTIRDL